MRAMSSTAVKQTILYKEEPHKVQNALVTSRRKMYKRVLKFVDALLECFLTDARYFEKVLQLRHDIRKNVHRNLSTEFLNKLHNKEKISARLLLNEFSSESMRYIVDDVVSTVTEEKMAKWVKFVVSNNEHGFQENQHIQKFPAYTEQSSSSSSSSIISSSSISSMSSSSAP